MPTAEHRGVVLQFVASGSMSTGCCFMTPTLAENRWVPGRSTRCVRNIPGGRAGRMTVAAGQISVCQKLSYDVIKRNDQVRPSQHELLQDVSDAPCAGSDLRIKVLARGNGPG